MPVVFLTGPAAYLFIPLALSVVFAMLASYFLSRTLVPTMMLYLLPKEVHLYSGGEGDKETGRQGDKENKKGGVSPLSPTPSGGGRRRVAGA